MREIIEKTFLEVFRKQSPGNMEPELADDLVLLESGLDSLGFAVLIVSLEEKTGIDPFSNADEAFYPKTFLELVKFYEPNQP